MPRIARFVLPGHPHHALQRGNGGQKVFLRDEDYLRYLELLREQSRRHRLRVIAYCLLPDHVRLVATPADADSLARAIGGAHFRYAQHFNQTHGRGGHLWGNRFASCLLEGPAVLQAVRCVERAPVRARLVRSARRWGWSSAAAHTGEIDFSGVLDQSLWSRLAADTDWRDLLRRREDAEFAARLDMATSTGRPLTTPRFLERIETELGRRLHALPPGRPRKRPVGSPRS